MKKQMKNLVVAVLGRQVRKLRKKHQLKVIGVVGGIGKTSTKLAIAETLSKSMRVQYQQGNYNDIVSVPLVFFGQPIPSLMNPFAWLKVFMNNNKMIRSTYPYDVVVVELGTDMPGQIAAFKQYLQLDIAVVTAIVPEHMANFADMQAVAAEELAVTQYADKVIYNADLIANEFRPGLPESAITYSQSSAEADYHLANIFHSAGGFEGDVKTKDSILVHFTQEVVSETQLYSMMAAVIVSKEMGLKAHEIVAGLANIRPVSGRLRRLRGLNNSLIIDDTYNASPEAVKAGLQMLYKLEAPQKVAVLGSMNELGTMSETAHKQVGELCDPQQLGLVVTIGSEANKFTASAAEAKGCLVKKFESPYEAGEYLQQKIEPEAIIFAKGSQNGVFAEEAIKLILADPEDASKLVRQSADWMKVKAKQFGRK